MASVLINRVLFRATSAGTGSFVVSSAITGYMTPATGGAVNSTVYSYAAESDDRTEWEIGTGTYTTGDVTLTRTPLKSSNADAAVDFTAAPKVALTGLAADFVASSILTTRGDLLRRGASAPERVALGASGYALKSDGTDAVWAASREVLTANRTYYVRSDGSDSNTGLVDSAGGAFLTIQKAWDVIVTLDLAGYTATIDVGTATFTAGLNATVPPVGGNVTINGDGAANTIISITSGNACIYNSAICNITVQNMKLTGTTGAGVRAFGKSSKITIGSGVEFGANSTAHIWAQGGEIAVGSNYTVSGGASYLFYSQNGGLISAFVHTVTISGTPAFGTATAGATANAVLSLFSVTFSGAATGTRYSSTLNAVINTFGGGASYIPGNAAGSTATGGQYA